MEKKQTAVEWFIEQLTKNPLPQSKDEFIDGDLVHIINKAKEIEKEHIIDAFASATTNDIISKLVTKLKNDKEYFDSWKSNIAMAYIDCENWYKIKNGKKQLNKEDKHIIANNSAEHFLILLCKD